ncbi:hypothetical protein IGI04_030395 [Brassica rapa subsp. trilocularis]|uniref:Uncharacterized protein n=1 Tax=Brassica rapa subsp. trilocularis TaxID=1813537 RepID=A0ABQ7LQM9_BRACM|nr:hypothetical protein IGI04_030395 [Brassica rapa subsp. trilocularis]
MHNSEASHPALHEHLRPSIHAEEAAGFHKRVKRIHVLVKIVVPCTVFEVEFPITPDRSVHLGSYNGIFYDHMYALATQRGLRFGGEIDKGPIEAASIDTSTSSSIYSGRVSEQKEFKMKFRVRSRFFSQPFAKLRALLMSEMIDKGEESMEAHKRRVMNLKKRDTDICFGVNPRKTSFHKKRRCLASIGRQSISSIDRHLHPISEVAPDLLKDWYVCLARGSCRGDEEID